MYGRSRRDTRLVVDDRGEHLARYWDFDFPISREPNVTPSDLACALEDAVRVRLRSESGRVACALSGGIDSSSIAALAARHQDGLDCFSIAFADDAYDETAIAARTAKHLGANLQVVRVSSEMLFDALPNAVAQSEGLAINFHLSAKWFLARAVRRAGYKVLLTGEGADEVLVGYPHFRHDLLRERGEPADDLARMNPASAGLMMPEMKSDAMLDVTAFTRALGFVPSFIEAKAALGLRASSLLDGDFKKHFRIATRTPKFCRRSTSDQMRGRERVDQSSYAWSKLALAGYICERSATGRRWRTQSKAAFVSRSSFLRDRTRGADVGEGSWRRGKIHFARGDARHRSRRSHRATKTSVSRACDDLAHSGGRRFLRSNDLPGFFDARAIRSALDRLERAPVREAIAWEPPLMLALTATMLARAYGLEDS